MTQPFHTADFSAHNREAAEVWDAFYSGTPIRVPMITGVSDRFFVMNPNTNPQRVSFEEYSKNPSLMFDMQCDFAAYKRFHIVGDHEMGIPENGWSVAIDFQNYYEAAWYGCQVRYPKNEVPYAVPMLGDEDTKARLFDAGLPDPFGGFMATAMQYYEVFQRMAAKREILGQKISHIDMNFTGTDGPFTLACELRGADRFCMDLYDDPEYAHALLAYLTDSIIARCIAWRKLQGLPERTKGYHFADDSVMLLSVPLYEEFVLPCHKRLSHALSTMEEPGSVHLCGNASHLYPTIRDALNIRTFDTGFPIDHRKVCLELGRETIVQGGPRAQLVKDGSIDEIRAESKRILDAVMPVTKRFVFREGNDMPPYTPLEHIQALYDACREYGRFM